MAAPTPKEIRDCYSDYRNEWQEIRDEAATDMRYVAGDPWDPKDRALREGSGRPCVSLDELSQYLNQYINNLRQNKRAIQVMPKGNGASDADAKKRADLIMGIEERSNAQNAYITAAENAANRSYGFAVIRTEYKDLTSFDQEIIIKPILNPDTVLLSPYYKQPDASDIPDGFIVDQVAKTDFKRKYPNAEVTDFSGQVMADHGVSDWITEKYVQVAEYWKVEYDRSKLLLVETQAGPVIYTDDEWKEMKEKTPGVVKRERTIAKPRVLQYMTNGLEILDEVAWAGTRIPIITCLGKELWLTEGGQAKRHLLSMVRLARDPQMLFAFLATQECEEAGMVPKTPFIGAKGQFESDLEAWEEINKVPHAFVQYDAMTDPTGQNALPPPSRPQYVPNFQQYELAKDSARRSIQAAMGISPLPTAAQRSNEKSGVALERIANTEAVGTFHFTDNFDRFLHNCGWQINELITPILDTQREQGVTKADGTRTTMHLVGNTSHPITPGAQGQEPTYEVQGLDPDHLHTGKGDYDVTISTGPNYQSEREEQSAFVDKLIDNMQGLPQPGTPAAKVLALGIRMRPDLGAIGQQMADVFDPPPTGDLPPQAQAQIQQMQAQLQQAMTELAALHADRAGRVLEQQTKITLQQMKNDSAEGMAQLQNDMKILTALITAKNQQMDQEAQMYREFWLENHGAAHEFALQQNQQAHDKAQSAAAAQQARLAQTTQIGADQASQESAQQAEPQPQTP